MRHRALRHRLDRVGVATRGAEFAEAWQRWRRDGVTPTDAALAAEVRALAADLAAMRARAALVAPPTLAGTERTPT